ncbi:MAG: feruloyl-CoA synthase, partial [Nannocystaceae bacterium]
VSVTRREDGTLVLQSPRPLEPYPRCLGERLDHWARVAPDRPFLGERDGDGFRVITYGEARARVVAVASGLLALGLGPARPVAILSDNSIDHAILALGAMHVGIPAAPVSPAYSLLSGDHARLSAIVDLLAPGLVFADDPARYARAIAAIQRPGLSVIHDLAALTTAPVDDAAVAQAHAATGPDTVAKVLFTSGSTGAPKGVLNTQRMLCSNQQSIAQLWPFLRERPPVLVDWLPWNHTFGGNHNFNMALFHGGALYIDDGRPAPGLVEKTVASLRAMAPTLYFNVPRGFDALLPYLEDDAAFAAHFFSRLDLMFYAAAALPESLWRRLSDVSLRACGRAVFMSSAWGATETAPLVTSVHFPVTRAGVIGLPAPGCELRLVPRDGKLELRVRGPGVTPGYLHRPDLTAQAFDEEGAYITGDAGAFVDPDAPARGVVFDGRVAEDFKLGSGVWVRVGSLRVDLIAAVGACAQDIVIAGEGGDRLGALIFPGLAACRALVGDATLELRELVAHPRVIAEVAAGLARHNAQNPHSSRRIDRALLLAEPPRIDAGEITDKGYINQRMTLTRRADAVVRVLSDPPGPEVIVASASAAS